MNSICGIDCDKCELAQACKGCEATDGKPFGGGCVVAEHCRGGKAEYEAWKESLLQAFRTLGIPELEGLSDLNPLTKTATQAPAFKHGVSGKRTQKGGAAKWKNPISFGSTRTKNRKFCWPRHLAAPDMSLTTSWMNGHPI